MNIVENLIKAEKIASLLFDEITKNDFLIAGKTEQQLSDELCEIAHSKYGIEKHWHKRLVRSGANTLFPYYAELPNLTIEKDDIIFFDFGPLIDKWEADFGRSFVLGNDPLKHKLKQDIEEAWYRTKDWFDGQTSVSGAELYQYAFNLAKEYNWEFGGEIAGHLIGEFPHEKVEKGNYNLYIHPENHNDMRLLDKNEKQRHWILEIHFIDREKQIGGFFEQLLC